MAEDNKQLKIGAKVKFNNKIGTVVEMADKVKVKFDDDSFGLFEDSQLEQVLIDSRLKGQTYMSSEAEGKDPLAQGGN